MKSTIKISGVMCLLLVCAGSSNAADTTRVNTPDVIILAGGGQMSSSTTNFHEVYKNPLISYGSSFTLHRQPDSLAYIVARIEYSATTGNAHDILETANTEAKWTQLKYGIGIRLFSPGRYLFHYLDVIYLRHRTEEYLEGINRTVPFAGKNSIKGGGVGFYFGTIFNLLPIFNPFLEVGYERLRLKEGGVLTVIDTNLGGFSMKVGISVFP